MKAANRYNATSHNVRQKKLNTPALIKSGAVRITVVGPGASKSGRPGKTSDPAGKFSVVTPKNPQARGWKNKPNSYKTAERLFDKGWLDDGKYRQIVDSARKLGLSDKRIFKKRTP